MWKTQCKWRSLSENWWNEAGCRVGWVKEDSCIRILSDWTWRRNRWSCFPIFSCKCCLCKVRLIQNILVWAGSTTRHCSENRENKTQHCEAIVIPTSGRQNTVRCLTQWGSCLLRNSLAWASGMQFAFFAQVGWRQENILIDVFSLIKPMKEHLRRTQMLNFLRNVF